MPNLLTPPIRVENWQADENFEFHPIGSQPKRVLICPTDIELPELIPGHSYIFKTTKKSYQYPQIWSEVIAAEIGAFVGVDVPPCFIAFDAQRRETGVLMEFFYGFPDDTEPARFLHATDFLHFLNVRTPPAADNRRLRLPHSVTTNLKVCRAAGVANFIDWWGKVLAFDALIGNTDRHTQNWGLLNRRSAEGRSTYTLAPAFDNGTSLGYERAESHLARLSEPGALAAYIAKGMHDCGWHPSEDRPTAHFELCRRFLETYPQASAGMLEVAQVEQSRVVERLNELSLVDVPVMFSAARAQFVARLIEARRATLLRLWGG